MAEESKAPTVSRRVIGDEAASQRVDNFLLRVCRGVPKSHIYRIVRSGEVRVNGRRVGAGYKLNVGDEIRIPPMRVAERVPTADGAVVPPREFSAVFEDDAVLIIDKPAGIAVHGGSGVSFGVIEQLRRARPDARFLELAHRLDRDTSGLLIVAKRRSALTALHAAMRDGRIDKRYLAVIRGRWTEPVKDIRLALHKYLTSDGERRVAVRADGKPAHSIVSLISRWENFSLVEVELVSGRTHQIRVHLAHHGFPLCGDDKYGDFALNRKLHGLGMKRLFLHASKLELAHPLTGATLKLEAPLPGEFVAGLRAIDANEKREHGPRF